MSRQAYSRQAYSNPKRASDPHSLPDVGVFYLVNGEIDETTHAGWYYWFCFPGCLPDSDAIGPFATEVEALIDARTGCEEDEEDEEAAT